MLSSHTAIRWCPSVPGIRYPKASCCSMYLNAVAPSNSRGGFFSPQPASTSASAAAMERSLGEVVMPMDESPRPGALSTIVAGEEGELEGGQDRDLAGTPA